VQILVSAERRNNFADYLIPEPVPVLALCRELLAAGLDPDAAVEAYRAGTLALRVRSPLVARGSP
jgi:hypothetical protein